MKGKRLLTILLCVMLIGILLPAGVFASENADVSVSSVVSENENQESPSQSLTESGADIERPEKNLVNTVLKNVQILPVRVMAGQSDCVTVYT